MKLQTHIPIKSEEPKIDYSSKVLLLGSCFSENIGERFDFFKFQNLQNPFGVIFNPISIEKLIIRAIENKRFSESDILYHDETWKCLEVHSELSALDQDSLFANLNTALQNLREALLNSTHIIFTYGTSWVYRHLLKDEVVANCHKLPQRDFKKELLSISSISESITNTISKISELNQKASIIFTVSPVRHIKDGFIENTLSKAHLITAINDFLKPQSKVIILKSSYFPSYEIMMDELRDYRFYSQDMLHPSDIAIDIIWDKFAKAWISSETEDIKKQVEHIQNGLKHRPFNPNSKANKEFQNNLQLKIEQLKAMVPTIYFSAK